jgi:hypothetical protein
MLAGNSDAVVWTLSFQQHVNTVNVIALPTMQQQLQQYQECHCKKLRDVLPTKQHLEQCELHKHVHHSVLWAKATGVAVEVVSE